MKEEFNYVVDLMRKIHDNWDPDLKILHAEQGVMYTVQIGKNIYKGLKTDQKPLLWQIIEMR